MRRATVTLLGAGLVLIGALLGQFYSGSSPDPAEEPFRKLRTAYDVVRESYVESVSSDRLVRTSIEGMVEPLDEYSAYMSQDRMKEVEETFRGSFEGIGITYELINGPRDQDTIGVLSVLPKGPSAEAGLRAGDRIVQVDGNSAVGWSHREIRRRLKGPGGSSVSVGLRRPGRSTLVRTTITRGDVPLQTVETQYMIGDSTGYIRLSRFAETTHREVSDALETLNDKGMRRLIFDLRGNTGGLMSMAEKVADEFLVDDQLIVRSKSRHDEYGEARYASGEGQFERRPLIALVDEHSASASEIVAGALQDHDRALVIGRRTFGKGLIQRQFDFQDGSGLRLTVARFYTPSGRLLQRPDSSGDSLIAKVRPSARAETTDLPDSLVHRTDAGRRVIGGGGILPDRVVGRDTLQGFRHVAERRGLIRDFARRWIDARSDSLRRRWEGRKEAFVDHFTLPSSTYPAFLRFAADRGIHTSLEDSTSKEIPGGDSTEVGPEAETFPAGDVEAARSTIETLITSYVGRRLFGPALAMQFRNRVDPMLEEARRSWPTAQQWAEEYPVD